MSSDGQSRREAVLVGVLGFDEKFLARCAMRVYTGSGLSRIVLIEPEPSDDLAAKRMGEARSYLEKLAREYLGAPIIRVPVPHGSFKAVFLEGRRAIMEAVEEGYRVVVCLSSGMRYTLAALMAAAVTLPYQQREEEKLNLVTIQVDLESGAGYVEIPLRPLRELARASRLDQRVLEYLWSQEEPRRLTDIADALGMAKSTTWKILARLKEAGLVEEDKKRYRALFPAD